MRSGPKPGGFGIGADWPFEVLSLALFVKRGRLVNSFVPSAGSEVSILLLVPRGLLMSDRVSAFSFELVKLTAVKLRF